MTSLSPPPPSQASPCRGLLKEHQAASRRGTGATARLAGRQAALGSGTGVPSLVAPSSPVHASALGAAILPLPLARPSAGVNNDFQHKTKMAAAASGECPDENASNELDPAPLGNCPLPGSLKGHTPEESPLAVRTGHRLLRVADGIHYSQASGRGADVFPLRTPSGISRGGPKPAAGSRRRGESGR